MKLWVGYGSEHSSNLVMIGHFKDVDGAKEAKETIDRIAEQVKSEEQSGKIKVGEHNEHFSDSMLALLQQVKTFSMGASELEQFVYDVTVKVEKNDVVVTTDEIEISAFLKILIDRGARLEIYSAHDYPGTGHGRGG